MDKDNRRYCIEPLEAFRAMRNIIAARDEIEYRLTRQWRYATEFRGVACNVLSQALVDSWTSEPPENAKPLPYAEAMAAERLDERIAASCMPFCRLFIGKAYLEKLVARTVAHTLRISSHRQTDYSCGSATGWAR